MFQRTDGGPRGGHDEINRRPIDQWKLTDDVGKERGGCLCLRVSGWGHGTEPVRTQLVPSRPLIPFVSMHSHSVILRGPVCTHTQTHTHSTLVSKPWGAADQCLETRSSSAEHENASETFLWHHEHRIKVSEDQSRVMLVNCTVKSTHLLHCTCHF